MTCITCYINRRSLRSSGFLLDKAILLEDEHCENFQFSKGFLCEYDCSSHSLMQLKMNDREVKDEEYLMSYDFIKLDGVPRLVIHDGGEKE